MKDFLQAHFSNVSVIHFIGIGGIGMSGIAELFHHLGYKIQGSDVKTSSNISRLESLGIKVFIGHNYKNVENADIVVVSSAISKNNVEYIRSNELSIPIFKRARMLAELMRFKWGIAIAGTHGKTTTTSLVSHLFQENNYDPTAIIGGIVNSWGQNSRFGQSKWIIAESDESDGSFVDLPATISIVTNIEAEHMDYYKNYDRLKDYFIKFINNIPFYGFSIICIDDKGVQDIMPLVKNTKIITYGASPQADFKAYNIRYDNKGAMFDVFVDYKGSQKEYNDFYLPMHGHHNVLNALSAIVLSLNIGLKEEEIKKSLASFGGVNRRYTKIGEQLGISFIDDYAHHPSEIEAVINATISILKDKEKMVSIVQPHRYSRLKDQFDNFCKCFNKSHYVIILDVYDAGEQPIENIDGKSLAQGIQNYGHKQVFYLNDENKLADLLLDIKNESKNKVSMAIFMGAGNISAIARDTLAKFVNITTKNV